MVNSQTGWQATLSFKYLQERLNHRTPSAKIERAPVECIARPVLFLACFMDSELHHLGSVSRSVLRQSSIICFAILTRRARESKLVLNAITEQVIPFAIPPPVSGPSGVNTRMRTSQRLCCGPHSI